jgi:3',5'-cyclic AMP phosphodiesterase CpdA
MRLVHLTDPHLTRPPGPRGLLGRSAFGKRYLGYLSWQRKRRHQLRRGWLDELTAEVVALAPDQIIVSGDLTQIGTAEELDAARGWLEQLGPPERVLLVPGNHDAYGPDSWANLSRAWGPYLPGLGRGGFPVVRDTDDGVLLLGLNSAEPTPPLSATGALGKVQLSRLHGMLDAHRDRLTVLAVHHPPLPGLIGYRKRLRDAGRLAALLTPGRAHVILHGHRHLNQTSIHDRTRVFCTAPASAERAAFRVLEVTGAAAGWQLSMSRHERTASGFEIGERLDWQVSPAA